MRRAIKLAEVISPRLAIAWVTRLFRKPARKKIRKKQQLFYKSGNTEILNIKNYTIKVFIKGDGEPVYLNHGWGSYGYDMKTIAHILLEKGYRVIIPDLPCHGRSSGKLTDQVEMSKIVETLLLHYNAQTPLRHIVTHSWGGAVTLLALDRIRAAGHQNINIQKMVSVSMPSEPRAIMNIFCDILDLSETIRKGMVLNMTEIAQNDNRTVEGAFPMGLTALLGSAPFDYLLIHGKDDKVVSYKNSLQLAAKYTHIQTRLKDDLGHIDILKDESAHTEIIRYFEIP